MIHVALYQPEIPPNTGNIIRLAANTGALLHLIHPLGFMPDDKKLLRAGLDYHEWTRVHHHETYDAFIKEVAPTRLIACSTRGTRHYTDIEYHENDVLLFGSETKGLPQSILATFNKETLVRIPMRQDSRSLNLSNAVAVVLYEALRQIGFSMISLI